MNGDEEESHDHNHSEACEQHSHHYEHSHECGLVDDSEHQHEHVCEDNQVHQHEHDAHSHMHHHSSLHDIEHIVSEHLALPQKVQDDIMAVYGLIAQAESNVHGVPVTDIHFHEVGTMDAIADITAVCLLMNRLAVDKVVVSPIHVGSGQVRCAHGILPVPAPATAYILRDVPIYGGSIRGELCTPTGAALLKYFAADFGSMPVMKVKNIGYGMGKKDFDVANCVRVMLGETMEQADKICELSCNVDDMTGEAVGFAKSRPGTLIKVMCREKDKESVIQAVFKHTTTIGIRENVLNRYVLDRHIETVQTNFGSVRCKVSQGYGVERRKYEYDDISRIAVENNISIEDVMSKLNN